MYTPIIRGIHGYWMIYALVDIGRGRIKRLIAPAVCHNLGVTNWKPVIRFCLTHSER